MTHCALNLAKEKWEGRVAVLDVLLKNRVYDDLHADKNNGTGGSRTEHWAKKCGGMLIQSKMCC